MPIAPLTRFCFLLARETGFSSLSAENRNRSPFQAIGRKSGSNGVVQNALM
jgi:hypothetical protein